MVGPAGFEIERRWRVRAPPEGAPPGARLEQGYLNRDGTTTVRLRADGDQRLLTIKRGRGLRRVEVEVALDAAQFEALWPLTEGLRVAKTRHRIPHGGRVIELDVFSGALAPLIIAEVEFDSVAEAEAYRPPSWFDEELTGVPGWSNSALARAGLPPGVRGPGETV